MPYRTISFKSISAVLLTLSTIYCLLSTVYSPVQAQEPDYDQVNEIAKKLNCPTCTGINLADCRTQTCEQWRDQIKDLLKQGYNDQEIINYFTTRFGDQVLQEPPKSGWTLALWVVPAVAVLLGGVGLLYAMRSWKGDQKKPPGVRTLPTVPASANTVSGPDNYLRQVEHDLQVEDS
jgi:cytochrome c-type biogenesis protein CcmH